MARWRRRAAILTIGVLAIGGAPAQARAGGDYSFRKVTQSSIEACPPGHEVELFHAGANVTSWGEEVAIACLTGKDRASWVLASATLCDDENSASGERYCSGKEAAASHVPALMRDTKSSIGQGKSPPYTIYYQLLRWGFGHDCAIEQQPYTVSGNVNFNFHLWHCAALTFGDTFDGGDSPEPLGFHPHLVWTRSNVPQTSDHDDDPTARVPLDFAIGADGLYTYRFR